MRPLAVHHVSINVDDVEAAIAFYCDTLGLEQRTDRPDFGFGGAWLDAGGQQVHLIEGTTPAGHGQHFALLVDSLDETVAELRGVAWRCPIRDRSGRAARPLCPTPPAI
jgi:glyoxylase I family protein